MSICSAESEGADARDPARIHCGPGLHLFCNLDRQLIPAHVRIETIQARVRRNHAVLQGQDNLDESCDSGGGFQMAYVCLERSQKQRTLPLARPKDCAERLSLDRIAQGRAGSMRLDITDLPRIHARIRMGSPKQFLLGLPIGHGESAGRSILIDGRSSDHSQNAISIGLGLREALQDNDAASFAANKSICCLVKGFTKAVRRQHAGLSESDRKLGSQDQVDSAGQRDGALAVANRGAGQMHGDERGRAGGIH